MTFLKILMLSKIWGSGGFGLGGGGGGGGGCPFFCSRKICEAARFVLKKFLLPHCCLGTIILALGCASSYLLLHPLRRVLTLISECILYMYRVYGTPSTLTLSGPCRASCSAVWAHQLGPPLPTAITAVKYKIHKYRHYYKD